MSHSKSCRCKSCCSSLPDCSKNDCPPHWKNRFCKLRKQWSEHSKCGSIKLHPEDYTYCRSPCEKTIGTFGVAWVADLPGCENGQPKGWQVEISDSTPGILKKCKGLVEWLNNPPVHLFDSIKGDELFCNTPYPKCLNNCDDYIEEPCCLKSALYKCEDIRTKKKCRISCSEEKDEDEDYCIPCEDSETHLNDNRKHKCVSCVSTCQNKCCGCENQETLCSKYNDDSSDPEYSKTCQTKCRWYCPVENDGFEIFKKQSCSCQCQDRCFKDVATSYEIDTIPQKDFTDNAFISDLSEVDSKIICAGIRSSKICRKLKEEKIHQLMDKREKELNTVIGKKSSEEEVTRSLYISAEADNQSVLNSNLITNSVSSQRRSSKFRRKESR